MHGSKPTLHVWDASLVLRLVGATIIRVFRTLSMQDPAPSPTHILLNMCHSRRVTMLLHLRYGREPFRPVHH